MGIVYALCLVSFVSWSGYAWRAWQFERRGIERPGPIESDQRLGINIELAQYGPQEIDIVLDDVASLGFYWLRQRFPWAEIEPQPNEFDWPRWDAAVGAVKNHGLGLIAVLDGFPDWAARRDPVPLPCTPPFDQAAFARFAAAFSNRYRTAIDHYQVWDEPNLSRRWGDRHAAPCGYAVLLQAAYPAIHAADPTAWVLGGGLAPTQAPGPDNLNDLDYLRRLYASGGSKSFDILAVKPYGFWSGPEDRRVAPHVLNFSRIVAARETMRTFGDERKPVWAVEWGWNVLPAGWTGAAPPWGSDTVEVQGPRVAMSLARARAEWPWLGPLCWVAFQPDAMADDPRWGFALRDAEGRPTELYDVFRAEHEIILSSPSVLWTARWLGLLCVGLGLAAPWLWRGWREAARGAWFAWASLPPLVHSIVLAVLTALYALSPLPEWILLAYMGALAVFWVHPRWALIGTALAIPFFYWAKPVGDWLIAPSEALLLSAAMVHLPLRRRAGGPVRWAFCDAIWICWMAVGALSLPAAPDPALAWREWRLCMAEPALLYGLVRLESSTRTGEGVAPAVVSPHDVLLAWAASGAIVALIGVGQWLSGTWVPVGAVGRVTGVYYSPNHLALYLERVLPLPLAYALCGDLTGRRRWVARGATILLILGLYLTYSRGAWMLAIPAAVLTVGWRMAELVPSFIWPWRLHKGMAAVTAGLLLLACLGVSHGRWGTPLLEEVRFPVWQSTVEMIGDHLWTGVGLDGFQFVYSRYMRAEAWTEPLLYHPHNMWLDAAVRLGLPGLVVFLLLVTSALGLAIRCLKNAPAPSQIAAIGLLAGLVGGLMHGLVDSGYFLPDLAWSLALVSATVASWTNRADPGIIVGHRLG